MLAILIAYRFLVRGQIGFQIGEKPELGICEGSHLKAQAWNDAIARPHLTDVFPATGAMADADASAAPAIAAVCTVLARDVAVGRLSACFGQLLLIGGSRRFRRPGSRSSLSRFRLARQEIRSRSPPRFFECRSPYK